MKATKREAICLEVRTMKRALRLVRMQRNQLTRELRYIPSVIMWGLVIFLISIVFAPKVEAPVECIRENRLLENKLTDALFECQKQDFIEPEILPL
mgnify:CR=1